MSIRIFKLGREKTCRVRVHDPDEDVVLAKHEAISGISTAEVAGMLRGYLCRRASVTLFDENGRTLKKHKPCHRCGEDEIGSHYEQAWCHACGWRGEIGQLKENQP